MPVCAPTFPLASIHPFTRQIVPLVCEELLTRSSSKLIPLEFCISHTKSFLQLKNIYTAVVVFLSFIFIAHFSWTCVNPGISI